MRRASLPPGVDGAAATRQTGERETRGAYTPTLKRASKRPALASNARCDHIHSYFTRERGLPVSNRRPRAVPAQASLVRWHKPTTSLPPSTGGTFYERARPDGTALGITRKTALVKRHARRKGNRTRTETQACPVKRTASVVPAKHQPCPLALTTPPRPRKCRHCHRSLQRVHCAGDMVASLPVPATRSLREGWAIHRGGTVRRMDGHTTYADSLASLLAYTWLAALTRIRWHRAWFAPALRAASPRKRPMRSGHDVPRRHRPQLILTEVLLLGLGSRVACRRLG